jgi:hypothetical protein
MPRYPTLERSEFAALEYTFRNWPGRWGRRYYGTVTRRIISKPGLALHGWAVIRLNFTIVKAGSSVFDKAINVSSFSIMALPEDIWLAEGRAKVFFERELGPARLKVR